MSETTSVAKHLFELQTCTQLYHWKTTNYARHSATDKLYRELVGLGDQLIESMATRYGRPGTVQLGKVPAFTDSDFTKFLEESIQEFWTKQFKKLVKTNDTDLHSLRDSIVTLLRQTQYLLTMQ
jgi:hypothetical protein